MANFVFFNLDSAVHQLLAAIPVYRDAAKKNKAGWVWAKRGVED